MKRSLTPTEFTVIKIVLPQLPVSVLKRVDLEVLYAGLIRQRREDTGGVGYDLTAIDRRVIEELAAARPPRAEVVRIVAPPPTRPVRAEMYRFEFEDLTGQKPVTRVVPGRRGSKDSPSARTVETGSLARTLRAGR